MDIFKEITLHANNVTSITPLLDEQHDRGLLVYKHITFQDQHDMLDCGLTRHLHLQVI